MKKMKEYKIGSEFNWNNKKLKVVPRRKTCGQCHFFKNWVGCLAKAGEIGFCEGIYRTDGKDVKFKEI